MTAVLLAEPEPTTRDFLARHLADDGFDVVDAAASSEALELAERAKPALVVSSLDFCRRLREGEPGRSWDRDVPVIVLGEPQADAVDRVRAFARAGATISFRDPSTTTSSSRASAPCCGERRRPRAI